VTRPTKPHDPINFLIIGMPFHRVALLPRKSNLPAAATHHNILTRQTDRAGPHGATGRFRMLSQCLGGNRAETDGIITDKNSYLWVLARSPHGRCRCVGSRVQQTLSEADIVRLMPSTLPFELPGVMAVIKWRNRRLERFPRCRPRPQINPGAVLAGTRPVSLSK